MKTLLSFLFIIFISMGAMAQTSQLVYADSILCGVGAGKDTLRAVNVFTRGPQATKYEVFFDFQSNDATPDTLIVFRKTYVLNGSSLDSNWVKCQVFDTWKSSSTIDSVFVLNAHPTGDTHAEGTIWRPFVGVYPGAYTDDEAIRIVRSSTGKGASGHKISVRIYARPLTGF